MSAEQEFKVPKREILNESDVGKWRKSEARAKYMQFLHRINDAVRGLPTTSDVEVGQKPQKIIDLLTQLRNWIANFPPEDMGSQDFGNKAYHNWHAKLVEQAGGLVKELLPDGIKAAAVELVPYLLDAFGNATRIDYGPGHEASFLIFLLCLYELGVLEEPVDDRAVVLRVFHEYLGLVRRLQIEYRMEPVHRGGSFIFGSSQLIKDMTMKQFYRHDSLFFEAMQFINEFNETNPDHCDPSRLYNTSSAQDWEMSNLGAFAMYKAEVLEKFSQVQHLVFGSLFSIAQRANYLDESDDFEEEVEQEEYVDDAPPPPQLAYVNEADKEVDRYSRNMRDSD